MLSCLCSIPIAPVAPHFSDVGRWGLAEAAGLDQDLTCVVEEVESRCCGGAMDATYIKHTYHDNSWYSGIMTYNVYYKYMYI